MNNVKNVKVRKAPLRSRTGPLSCSSQYSLFTNGGLAACLDRSVDHNSDEFLISTNQDPSSS